MKIVLYGPTSVVKLIKTSLTKYLKAQGFEKIIIGIGGKANNSGFHDLNILLDSNPPDMELLGRAYEDTKNKTAKWQVIWADDDKNVITQKTIQAVKKHLGL